MEHSPPREETPGLPPAVTHPGDSGSLTAPHEQSLFEPAGKGWFAAWDRIPLYLRILGAVILGVLVGLVPHALEYVQGYPHERALAFVGALEIPSKLVLRLLGALAAPL